MYTVLLSLGTAFFSLLRTKYTLRCLLALKVLKVLCISLGSSCECCLAVFHCLLVLPPKPQEMNTAFLEGRRRLHTEGTLYAWCEGDIAISISSCDVSCAARSNHGAFSLFTCPICPSSSVFIPTSPMDGLLLIKVLGLTKVHSCAEERAGTAQVCKRNGWMISVGMRLVPWQASLAVLHQWVHGAGGEQSD